jgi:hypothetical protein
MQTGSVTTQTSDRFATSATPSTLTRRVTAAAIALVSVVINWPLAFNSWYSYDDEGIMLLTFRSFAERGGLYDKTYTNYGPFPPTLWWSLLKPFGFDFQNLAAGRLIALVLLTASTALTFLALRRHVSTVWATSGAFAVAKTLQANFREPFHPGALIGFLLCVAVWTHFTIERETRRAFILGLVGGALCLTKINVGVLFMVAWLLAELLQRKWVARSTQRLITLGACALPLVIVAGTTDVPTILLALSVAVTILLVALQADVSQFVSEPNPVVARGYGLRWGAAGFSLISAFSSSVVLMRGGSVRGLIDGILLRAVKQRSIFSIAPKFGQPLLLLFLITIAATFLHFFWSCSKSEVIESIDRRKRLAIAIAQIVCGVIFLILPEARVAILPALSLLLTNKSNLRSWLFPVLVAGLQVMHGYPVAGSQLAWGTLLLPTCGALLVAAGGRGLRETVEPCKQLLPLSQFALGAAVFATLVIGPVAKAPQLWSGYRSATELDNERASFVRLPAFQARTLRQVRDALEQNCSAFYSLPGMGTFHTIADLPLVTGYNGTIWPLLFDLHDQEIVLGQLQRTDRLCILRSERTLSFWTLKPLPDSPLVRYVNEFTTEIANIDGYQVLRRET